MPCRAVYIRGTLSPSVLGRAVYIREESCITCLHHISRLRIYKASWPACVVENRLPLTLILSLHYPRNLLKHEAFTMVKIANISLAVIAAALPLVAANNCKKDLFYCAKTLRLTGIVTPTTLQNPLRLFIFLINVQETTVTRLSRPSWQPPVIRSSPSPLTISSLRCLSALAATMGTSDMSGPVVLTNASMRARVLMTTVCRMCRDEDCLIGRVDRWVDGQDSGSGGWGEMEQSETFQGPEKLEDMEGRFGSARLIVPLAHWHA